MDPALKLCFDEIKTVVEAATVELLIRPDWEANIRCSDLVNAQVNPAVIGEVVFLLRRRLGSRHAKTVYLTIALVESLVKNCGTRLHAAVNDEPFMNEMTKVARKFVRTSGPEAREVAEMCLFLASERGKWITGQAINIDGGTAWQ